MDPATVSTAYSSLKYAKDMLQALTSAKIDAESLGRITEALSRLGQAQDAMFEMREELFALQQSNQELRRQLSEVEDWRSKMDSYVLVVTAGGAAVMQSSGEPRHYICPACVNKHEVQILQTARSSSGGYTCPGCKHSYPVEQRRDSRLQYPRFNN